MNPLVYDLANLPAATRETKRVFHHVRGAVRREAKYLRRNLRKLGVKSALLASVMGLEYFIGLSFIGNLIWDESAAVVAWIALIVPITAFAGHLLIAEGQEKVAARLRAYAMTGVLVLPIAMSLGLAVSMASSAIVGGGSTITGTVGGVSTGIGTGSPGSGIATSILDVLGAISPLLLIVAYGAALGISFYVAHRLFLGIEITYNKIEDAENRRPAVERICKTFDEEAKVLERKMLAYRVLKRKLPDHLEERFADDLFVVVSKTLRDMSSDVERQRIGLGPRDLFEEVYDRPHGPRHIPDIETAYLHLAEIRDKFRPHAVIAALGAAPPKWES